MLQLRSDFRVLAVLSLATVFGCRDQPKPVENTSATVAPSRSLLQPLSAHGDESAPVSEGAPSTRELPPGHPPIASGQGETARSSGTMPPGHPPVGERSAPMAGAPATGGTVSGTVDVASAQRASVSGGALFVIARNAKTHQIVAVKRVTTSTYPLDFSLSAADLMMEGVAFEGPFDVTARWSKSGDAMPGAGDVEGTVKSVAIGAKDVKVVLSEVRK